jgi:hypothetical protein
MRASTASIILVGGMLALGACAQSGPMTLAERTEHCERLGSSLEATGRQTGDARQDFRCRNIHATTYGHGSQNYRDQAAGRNKVIRSGG